MARIRLRSTLMRSASRGKASVSRSASESPRPCNMTRPSAVRKIDDVSSAPPPCQTSSTRKLSGILLLGRRCVRRGTGLGVLLFAIKPVDDAARLDAAGVGVDIDLRRIGLEADHALLRREHRHVLEESGPDLLEDAFRRGRIMRLEIVRLPPEIMRGRFRLRRDGVEIAHADAADAAA